MQHSVALYLKHVISHYTCIYQQASYLGNHNSLSTCGHHYVNIALPQDTPILTKVLFITVSTHVTCRLHHTYTCI